MILFEFLKFEFYAHFASVQWLGVLFNQYFTFYA